ncbi:MAG TPA: biotin/lipoyl-containing protein [bacterium]|jgi:biotin carboxyl carrier protein
MSERLTVEIGGREYTVDILPDRTLVNGVAVDITDVAVDGHCGLTFRKDGDMFRAVFERTPESFVSYQGRELPVAIETDRERLLKQFLGGAEEVHQHAEVRASMPGLIVRIGAEIGGHVTKGHAVIILEAMKMENEIRAPIDGTVREIRVRKGQPVEKGDVLMVLD